jgi:hypothetical protein
MIKKAQFPVLGSFEELEKYVLPYLKPTTGSLVLGIDPGPEKAACVLLADMEIVFCSREGKSVYISEDECEKIIEELYLYSIPLYNNFIAVIEKIEPMGQILGWDLLNTIYTQIKLSSLPPVESSSLGVRVGVGRREVWKVFGKGDAKVRAEIKRRFPNMPGLHAIRYHLWAALAIALLATGIGK